MTYIHANESISIGYSAKYNDFEHFDYVNPYSKKGWQHHNICFGTFDSLNPFFLNLFLQLK
jgi:ABC-type oligopeptide transport system substrate-binding subunit